MQGRDKCSLSIKCFPIPLGSWPTPGYSDGSTAMDSVTRVRRKKAGVHDADSTKTEAQMMRMHDAPYFYDLLVTNAVQACTQGLNRHSIQLISWIESTATEELDQLDSCLKQEPNVKIFPHSVNSLFCTATSTILVRPSRAPECREIGRRFAGKLWLPSVRKISH